MTLFDRYVIVDWSASSKPKRGRDSIWIASLQRDQPDPVVENIPTRGQAEVRVHEILHGAVRAGERALVGFDFSYGYPAGFAQALGLGGEPWSALWDFIASRIEDHPMTNANNRFEVANEINERLGPGAASFWGRPPARSLAHLTVTRDVAYGDGGVAEWRAVESRLRAGGHRPHSVWKLLGAGSVGSQALLGIPVVRRLRRDPALAPVSRVWPFEAGRGRDAGDPLIVHAEVWPSLEPVPDVPGLVKDAAQVSTVARALRDRDHEGTIVELFDAGADHVEEGWILGVTRPPDGGTEPDEAVTRRARG